MVLPGNELPATIFCLLVIGKEVMGIFVDSTKTLTNDVLLRTFIRRSLGDIVTRSSDYPKCTNGCLHVFAVNMTDLKGEQATLRGWSWLRCLL